VFVERYRTSIAVLGVLLAASTVNQSLWAQDPAQPQDSSWSIGASIGLAGYASETDASAFVLGFQTAQLRLGKLGGDLSYGTMPRLLLEGAIALGVRAGVVLPIGVSESTAVLPSAGLSALGAFGSGLGFADVGMNVGLGLLFGGRERTGLRLGATWHHLAVLGSRVWLVEVGFVVPKNGR
jgi:hypothetical protein